MNCQDIETIMNELKADSSGRIRGKGKCGDKIFIAHLKKVDSDLMDIRIFVARISTALPSTDILKMVDEFIYKKQIS